MMAKSDGGVMVVARKFSPLFQSESAGGHLQSFMHALIRRDVNGELKILDTQIGALRAAPAGIRTAAFSSDAMLEVDSAECEAQFGGKSAEDQ